MFRKVRYILLLLSLLLVNKSFAQKSDLSSEEIKLIKLYSQILSYSQENYDSISYYAERFENKFTNFIKNNSTTLDYSFKNNKKRSERDAFKFFW
jgi:hypothetical protein